ncbi:MAG: BLUF domain-containing protein [Stenotrophomonas sp.]|nr:BLUF domain-containing protein [Stenotrophomonas sp.]
MLAHPGTKQEPQMTHRAVAYVSTAVAGLTPADLDRLLIDARAHNRMEGVTGVLLHDGHRFFQYFEGPPAGVEKIYARIRDSRMHVGLQELQDGPVEQLYFAQWHMGCSRTDGSALRELSSRQWRQEARYLGEDLAHAGDTPGLRGLLAFWEQQQEAVAS